MKSFKIVILQIQQKLMFCKRVVFSFFCLLNSIVTLGQNMNIFYKDGGIQTEKTGSIDSVNFANISGGYSIGTLNAKIDKVQKEVDELKSSFVEHTYLFDWLKDSDKENGIARYVNTSNATDVVRESTDNGMLFKATIHSPYTFCNIGFNIAPELYSLEEKHYVVLLTGSVKAQNLKKAMLRNNNFSYTEMIGQDFEDGVVVEFKTLMNVVYTKGKTGNDRYVSFSHFPKENGKDIKIEYNISRYCVFDYKDGWSIKDYINCYDKGFVFIQNSTIANGTATEDYVDEAIEKLENNLNNVFGNTSPYSGNFAWDVNMIINYGQSLSVGGGAATINDDFRNVLSFPGGINEWATGLDIDDEKQVEQFYGNGLVELNKQRSKSYPPIASCALAWMSLLEKENHINLSNFDYQFLLSTPGYSGIEIEGLSKAGRFPNYKSPEKEQGYYYRRLLMGVRKGMENAHIQGKTFGVPCLFYVQGEANVNETEEVYYPKLKQLFDDLNTDIKAITGQKNDVVFITYQMSSFEPIKCASGPTYAQLRLAQEQENVYLGGAMYQYDYGTDKFHPVDRAIVGLQAGIVAKRIINDENPLPLFYPRNYNVQHSGNTWLLSIQFDVPVPPMRFVTDSKDSWHNVNGKQKNYGFVLQKNGIDIIAEEPVIKRGNTLVIRCKQDPTGASLSYATTGHYGGGNLCDSQNITIRCKSDDYVIDNFCPTFKNYMIK